MTDEEKARAERLNTAAKTLVTATTLIAGVLTAFGVTAERVPQLLDNEASRERLLIAAALTFVAFVFGIFALLPSGAVPTTVLLLVGAIALGGGMGAAVNAAAVGFSGNGRPTISAVTVSGSEPAVTVSFTVHADGVNIDERIGVFAGPRVYLADQGVYAPDPRRSFRSVLRPNDRGVIDQAVTFTIDPPRRATGFAIRAIRTQDLPNDIEELTADDPADCDEVENVVTACIDVDLPAPGLQAEAPTTGKSGDGES